MHYAKTALRFAIVIVVLAIMIPILFYVGIAALGLAVIGSIVAWFAGHRLSTRMRTQRQYAHTSHRYHARDGGIIIDHE